MVTSKKAVLSLIYRRLHKAFGPQHWWPGETPFEVMVGAILTQNTNWKNVEKAIANLKRENVCTPLGLKRISSERLAKLIKPAGYFNVKTRRLKSFISFFFEEYCGEIGRMKKEAWINVRRKLLGVNGIGFETADSILLYALNKPAFVVDAYTKRMLTRHRLCERGASYHDIQDLFDKNVKSHVKTFNEFHALIVRLGKDFCKSKSRCEDCPLNVLNKDKRYRRFRFTGAGEPK